MAHARHVAYVRTMIDETMLARARVASEVIGPLAVQIEQDRRLPPPAVEALVRAGVFKLLVPRTFGGSEAHPATMVAVIEQIARADGSAAWCTMVGATSGLMSIHLDEAVAREVYGPDEAVTCGVFAPMGRAVATEGGYRVSGRWPFASGCEHSKWRMGGAIVMGDAGPSELLPNGGPDVRSMLFRADETRAHDTWDTSGLRGSGSHDIEVTDVVVPRERSFSLLTGAPKHAGYTLPFFGVLASGVAAVGLGIARAAIDTFVAMAKSKTPPGSKRTLAHRDLVQMDVARAEAKLRSARAFLYEAVEEAVASPSLVTRARLRLAACHAAEESAAVVAIAYKGGGGSAIYAKSPLQRYFRDANVVTHHIMVNDVATTLAGRVLLGVESDTTTL
jgi:alkylation response protein AidB-like acyl-CoA dehydrogenase